MSADFERQSMSKVVETLEYPTPFFVFSKDVIQTQVRRFEEGFPDASIYYAVKANPHREILETVSDAGCGFEVASVYELRMLETLKIPAAKIIYGSCVKATSQIEEFYRYGVRTYAADSFSEIEKIATAAPESKVFIRVRVEDSGSAFRFSEKFGTSLEKVLPMFRDARQLGLRPYGLSFHVGSQARNPMAWAEALDSIAPLLLELRAAGLEAEMLNIGGGFPCAYASRNGVLPLEEIAANTAPRLSALPYRPKVILEPGRALVAKAGILVSSVIGRVRRGDKTWLFLDAGVYNALFEAMACQASIRYQITSVGFDSTSEKRTFALAGPTGDGLDVITRSARLPQDIAIGDKLLIHNTGAYSLALSSEFNGFAKPNVYFL